VRWREQRLLVAGPDGICWVTADHLVYAGGSRPATAAELRIAGPRLAGVLPATVALHFAEAGVLLGRRVVFVGCGDWAHAAAHVIAEQDCEITVVATAGVAPPRFRYDALYGGWTASAVSGRGRVGALYVERAGHTQRITCDAVILAQSPRPLRNVDGAVIDPCRQVTFAQPIGDTTTCKWAAAEAVLAVRELSATKVEEVTA
jgi:hypothetical protein